MMHKSFAPHSLLLVMLALACHSLAAPVSPIVGTYRTVVTLTSNTCTGITVQNNPTVVTHAPGAHTFTLTHAGLDYAGTLGANQAFTTAARAIPVGTSTHTLTIAGSFSTSGFVADVIAVVSGSVPCRYLVHWVGSR